jgi:hypothetical protein
LAIARIYQIAAIAPAFGWNRFASKKRRAVGLRAAGVRRRNIAIRGETQAQLSVRPTMTAIPTMLYHATQLILVAVFQ